jgi:hypothetical protein
MATAQIAEANKLMKAGKDKVTKGLFNWSPDYDDGADMFAKAASIFRGNQLWDQAKQAFELAAENYEKAKFLGHAAKMCEQAGMMLVDERKPLAGVPLLERAAKYYLLDDKSMMTSGILTKAARALLDTEDPSLAMKATEMLMGGITALENDDKHILTKDLYRLAVLCLLRAEKYDDAIATLKRQIPSLVKASNADQVAKNSLEIIIIWLHRGDGVQANRALQELGATAQGFSGSDEHYKAQDLLAAFDDRDQDRLAEVGKAQLLTFLIPEISRMAKRLKVAAGGPRPKDVAGGSGGGAAASAANDDDEENIR